MRQQPKVMRDKFGPSALRAIRGMETDIGTPGAARADAGLSFIEVDN
jgi:hypothetical protein